MQATSAPALSQVLSREEARALTARVLSFSTADQTRVTVDQRAQRQHAIRGRQHHDVRRTDNTSVTVTVTFGRRRASSSTNVLDEASLKRTVDLASRLARLAPEDPELMPELGPQTYTAVNAFVEATADLDAEARAEAIGRAIGCGDGPRASRPGRFSRRDISRPTRARLPLRRATGCSPTTARPTRTSRSPRERPTALAAAGPTAARATGARSIRSRSVGLPRRRPWRAGTPRRSRPVSTPPCSSRRPSPILIPLLAGALNARNADEGRSAFSKPGGGNARRRESGRRTGHAVLGSGRCRTARATVRRRRVFLFAGSSGSRRAS